MKRIISMALSAILSISLLSGCASQSTQGNSSGSGQKKENVFTYVRQADIRSWDAFKGTDTASTILGRMVYDSLIQGDRKDKFFPGLATEWKASDDGKKWTFKLRKGVKFHNGYDFNSADVKFTFERYAKDKTTQSINDWSLLDSVETPDPETAIFNFKAPYGSFLNAVLDTWIVSKKLYEEKGDELWKNPVGTGPWKFVSWTAGQQTVFTRNDDYWGWGDNKSNVDKFVYRAITEESTRLAAIQTGEADMVEGLNVDQVKQLQGAKGIKTDSILSTAGAYLNFKVKDSIFADKNLRQAVSLAIDRKTLVDTISTGCEAAVWTPDKTSLGYKQVDPAYDPEQAKKLVAQSTYKGQQFKIMAVIGQLPRANEVMLAITSMLNKVGINAGVEFLETAAMSSRRQGGNYDAYVVSAAFSAGDSAPYVTQRWMNDIYKSGYVNNQMFDLIKLANSELDVKKRDDLFRQVFQIAYDDAAPGVALYRLGLNAAYKDVVSGMKINADGTTDLTKIMKK